MNRPQKALWTKWVVLSCLVCFLVTICILFVRYNKAQPQEIIKIYRPVEATLREIPQSKALPTADTRQSVSTGQQEPAETFHNTTLEHVSELELHEAVSERTDFTSGEHGISGEVRDIETVPELMDAELEHEKWHTNILRKMAELNAGMAEKYPDIILISALSAEEILEIYPTEADRLEIQKRAESMQAEFIGQFSRIFSEFDPETQETVISRTRELFVENFGDEMADRVIADIMNALKR